MQRSFSLEETQHVTVIFSAKQRGKREREREKEKAELNNRARMV